MHGRDGNRPNSTWGALDYALSASYAYNVCIHRSWEGGGIGNAHSSQLGLCVSRLATCLFFSSSRVFPSVFPSSDEV